MKPFSAARGWWIEAVVALMAAWGAWTLYPAAAPPDDPLRATFAMVPLVAFALRWIARGSSARSGRAPRRMGRPEAALWLTLYFSLPFRHVLGWPFDDTPWAAGLALALGAAVTRRLAELRRLVPAGDATRPRPAAAFFFLPLVVYLAIQPWALETRTANGDEPYNLLVAHSLAYDLDVDLDNQYAAEDSLRFAERPLGPQLGDPTARDGARRSRHNALLPLLLAPGYRLAGRAGAAATMAVFTAALAWLFLRLALRGTRHAADRSRLRSGIFLAWAAFAFLPPLLSYAHQIWVEVPAALLLALAVDRLWTLRESRHPGVSRRDLLLFVGALVLLPLLKLRLLLVALPLLALAVPLFAGAPRRLALLVALPSTVLAGVLAFNAWVYGNPLKLYTPEEVGVLFSPPERYLQGLVGVFWDCAFGLFAFAPLWLLLLPGLALVVVRGKQGADLGPGVGRDLAVLSVPYLLAVAPRLEWYGGWAPPFRYPLVLLPLLALLLVPVLARRQGPGVHFLLVATGLPTLLLTLVWTVVPSWTYHLADGSQQLLHQAGIQLAADVGRLFPSTVRPRPATWIWVALSLLAVVPVLRRDRPVAPGARRRAASLAVALLLAALTFLPWLAETLPTRHVEVEDAWVAKRGGRLHPDRWHLRRPEYASGWLLSTGAELEIPVVRGGDEVRVDVRAARLGNGTNQLRAERRTADGSVELLGEWTLEESGRFADHPSAASPWRPGDRLVVSNPQAARRKGVGVVVDWVDLCWRGDPCWNASP